MSPKRIHKPKPRKGRVAMPPPQHPMRDRRDRRASEEKRRDLRRRVDELLDEIDDALEEEL